MPDDTDSGTKTRSGFWSGRALEMLWALGFLAIGGAMLIWPHAMPPTPACNVPDFQEDLLDSFIGCAWGKPEAVGLACIIGLLILVDALRRGRDSDTA